MTSRLITSLHCDAPGCDARAIVERSTDTPEGWTVFRSDAHLDGWKPGRLPTASGRTRQDRRTLSDVLSGSFRLHLCPEHPSVFAGHLPKTTGTSASGRRGSYERSTSVECSCGGFSTWGIPQAHRVAPRSEGPNYLPERAWWSHLPPELKAYGTRDHRKEAQP